MSETDRRPWWQRLIDNARDANEKRLICEMARRESQRAAPLDIAGAQRRYMAELMAHNRSPSCPTCGGSGQIVNRYPDDIGETCERCKGDGVEAPDTEPMDSWPTD